MWEIAWNKKKISTDLNLFEQFNPGLSINKFPSSSNMTTYTVNSAFIIFQVCVLPIIKSWSKWIRKIIKLLYFRIWWGFESST